jgi:hypothetical protein
VEGWPPRAAARGGVRLVLRVGGPL